MENIIEISMNKQGRVTIPAKFRKKLGLEPNQPLIIGLENNKLVIQDRASLKKEAMEFFSKQKKELGLENISVVDELIAERREAALKE